MQYLYKTGYDPNAFVGVFEKLQNIEEKKPGTVARAFRSHPMREDRIKAAQKDIREILPPRSEYVIDTSEFLAVKARLVALHAR